MSQSDRILALLETGPKTTRELLAEVPSIVHSRIATLRARGYVITCERISGEGAGAYRYTLVGRALNEDEAETAALSSSLSDGPPYPAHGGRGAIDSPVDTPAAAPIPGQLTIEEAA